MKSMELYYNRTIAIDFDGVLHRYSKGWHDGTIYDLPMQGARKKLIHLSKVCKIVIFTCRPDMRGIADWLIKHDIPFDEITNDKPLARVYIDDNAIRFTDWHTTMEALKTHKII